MNEIEAISVLETRIKYPNSDTYGGMCEAEYQQEAVVLAIEALREQAERSKGCEYCGLIYKLDGASYGTDSVIIENRFCPMCGKRLEVEHEN